jgi:hypothetical protein
LGKLWLFGMFGESLLDRIFPIILSRVRTTRRSRGGRRWAQWKKVGRKRHHSRREDERLSVDGEKDGAAANSKHQILTKKPKAAPHQDGVIGATEEEELGPRTRHARKRIPY